jgi:3-hydroxybutyryl-CoA dehydrogenase
MIQRAAVVGAGTMGNGIAHVFAQSGWDVVLVDVARERLDQAMKTIGGNMDRQVKKGSLSDGDKTAALKRIATATAMKDVDGASLIIEAATENPDIKFKIFAELDALAPKAILASNTSSMALGKTPVEVNDYPGFVSNRVLMPMINEAAFCVQEGVATPDAVDTVMKLGMNHPMGPLALADLIGLDVCVSILDVLQRGLGDDKYRACPLMRRMVAAGQLGRKSGKGFYEYR